MRFLAILLFLPAAASAFDPGTYLGAGVRSRPEYDGASEQKLQLIPLVRYYGPILFARTTQGVLEGGARAELVKGLFAGVQLAYEEENDRTGLDPGTSYGVHMEWDTHIGPAPINLLARTRFHFDSDNGGQTDLRASVGVYGSERLAKPPGGAVIGCAPTMARAKAGCSTPRSASRACTSSVGTGCSSRARTLAFCRVMQLRVRSPRNGRTTSGASA
jgi:hypothetical protein